MKKTKILTVILITIAVILSFGYKVSATAPGDNARQNNPEAPAEGENVGTSQEGETVTTDDDGHNHEIIDPSTMHEGDLYIASDEKVYTMDKIVNGNVFIFGNTVKITGQVYGSLFVFANKLIIEEEGYIGGQAFVAGYDIVMNGFAVDLYSASQTLKFGENAGVYRDVKSVAENMVLAGKVGRDIKVTADKLTIAENEARLQVYGNLEYEAREELTNIQEKADITGDIKYTKYIEKVTEPAEKVLDLVWGAIGTIIFDVVMYLALWLLSPKFVQKAKDYVSTKGLLALAIGLAFTILIPVIALLLLMTGVGAGLSGLLIFVYCTVLMFNAFMVTVVANEYIASKLKLSEDKFKKLLLIIPVSFVIWALRKLPFIGGWISIVVFLCGVGLVLLYQFDRLMKKE
ncbi:MAG: hypothetical protein HFJ51_01325 [Clostridia bacterium]|nr:hypothetical protein [Clostridia bacterium]